MPIPRPSRCPVLAEGITRRGHGGAAGGVGGAAASSDGALDHRGERPPHTTRSGRTTPPQQGARGQRHTDPPRADGGVHSGAGRQGTRRQKIWAAGIERPITETTPPPGTSQPRSPPPDIHQRDEQLLVGKRLPGEQEGGRPQCRRAGDRVSEGRGPPGVSAGIGFEEARKHRRVQSRRGSSAGETHAAPSRVLQELLGVMAALGQQGAPAWPLSDSPRQRERRNAELGAAQPDLRQNLRAAERSNARLRRHLRALLEKHECLRTRAGTVNEQLRAERAARREAQNAAQRERRRAEEQGRRVEEEVRSLLEELQRARGVAAQREADLRRCCAERTRVRDEQRSEVTTWAQRVEVLRAELDSGAMEIRQLREENRHLRASLEQSHQQGATHAAQRQEVEALQGALGVMEQERALLLRELEELRSDYVALSDRITCRMGLVEADPPMSIADIKQDTPQRGGHVATHTPIEEVIQHIRQKLEGTSLLERPNLNVTP